MRFSNDSIIIKVLGSIRFIITRFYYSNFKSTGLGLIGRSSDIIIKNNGEISCGKKLILSGYNQLFSFGKLQFGNNVVINEYSRIVAHEKIVIGNNVVIAKFVTMVDHDHSHSFKEDKLVFEGYDLAPIVVGDNVWISDKVTILKGVTIGENVIIAANSVVSSDVPDNSIVGGIPAKIIKKL